jgi:hypothetical protein
MNSGSTVFLKNLPNVFTKQELFRKQVMVTSIVYLEEGRGFKIKELRLWHYKLVERVRAFAQVELDSEHAMKLLAEHMRTVQFKGRRLSLVGAEHINRLVIYDISPAVREEEIYGILRDMTKGLYGVTLFDTNTPQGILSAGVCLVEYEDYVSARTAMVALIQRRIELRTILSTEFKVMWAEPLFDYFAEFALCTRVLHIKHLPLSQSFDGLLALFQKHGPIMKVRRYARHAFVFFASPAAARLAYESNPEIELGSGVVCKLSLARIKLKETTSAEGLALEGLSDSAKASTLSLYELGAHESIGLMQHLLHGYLPDQDSLLTKARNITKRVSFAHMAPHSAVPSSGQSPASGPSPSSGPIPGQGQGLGPVSAPTPGPGLGLRPGDPAPMHIRPNKRPYDSYAYDNIDSKKLKQDPESPGPMSQAQTYQQDPYAYSRQDMHEPYRHPPMQSSQPQQQAYMRQQPYQYSYEQPPYVPPTPYAVPPQGLPGPSAGTGMPPMMGRPYPPRSPGTGTGTGTGIGTPAGPAPGQKMLTPEQIRYLQQYIQMYKSNDPSVLQILSRLASQPPAKQV